ncbi:hypothetical protein F2P81_021408 [Scophthalmus maximus]|uniref:Uncharacterized protein n=1 Tax=Scophthalmus maximus TaxID=52904 RepID=A0A6A4S6C2_SCOMX|nr:hypothetical protein F2P81_021408 [Scophthalmus maximus]
MSWEVEGCVDVIATSHHGRLVSLGGFNVASLSPPAQCRGPFVSDKSLARLAEWESEPCYCNHWNPLRADDAPFTTSSGGYTFHWVMVTDNADYTDAQYVDALTRMFECVCA